jgi:hypothetical protein
VDPVGYDEWRTYHPDEYAAWLDEQRDDDEYGDG